MNTAKKRAEFIYNMILAMTEEDINETEDVIAEVDRIHCRNCDYTEWIVYARPPKAESEE